MDQATIEKLRSNPHYKMNSQQQGAVQRPQTREEMVELNKPQLHDQSRPTHQQPEPKRIKRSNKKVLE